MNKIPDCLKCNSDFTYKDGIKIVCPKCNYEWKFENEDNNLNIVVNNEVLDDKFLL